MIRDVVRYTPPQKWGVLCIDVWESNGNNDGFYHKALSCLSKYHVEVVVNCTTDLKIDYDDVSVYNTIDRYLWNPNSVNPQINRNVLTNLIMVAGHQQTNKFLQNNLFDHNTVHLSDRETFVHHAQCYHPDITDWIILGNTWKICLHVGPLGVDKLVEIGSHKFHIFPDWSIQAEHGGPPSLQDIHDDFFVWAPIDNDGYRLITRANNSKWTETT